MSRIDLSSHRMIQQKILERKPQVKLEVQFPEIGRIADVVDFQKKLIYEVQYSPITVREARKRNEDYASLGFQVIWVLHNKTFNKKKATPAEFYLRHHTMFYTSYTRFGHGFFFDQLEFFRGRRRIYRGVPLPLTSLDPRPLLEIPKNFPKSLKKKLIRTPYYFPGDATDDLFRKGNELWAKELEKSYLGIASRFDSKLYRSILTKSAAPHVSLEG